MNQEPIPQRAATTEARKPYQAPQFTIYGNVEDLTKAGPGFFPDPPDSSNGYVNIVS